MTTATFADTLHVAQVLNRLLLLRAQLIRMNTVGAPARPRLVARWYAAREALRTFDPFRRRGDLATCTFAPLANGLLTVGGAS